MMLSNLKILLAEDNPTNQMVATQMLESLGAEVTLAADGEIALNYLDEQEFDIALIDIEMPRISGIEFIRMVRSRPPPISQMPIIALTAYVMRDHREAIDKAGADGVIAKPILSINQFGEDIRSHLHQRGHGSSGAVRPMNAAANHAQVIDKNIYDALIENIGEDMMEELLTKVEADIQTSGENAIKAIAQQDIGKLKAASHILISVSGAIGATSLQTLAQRLNAIEILDASKAAKLIAGKDLEKEIAAVLDFVKSQQKG